MCLNLILYIFRASDVPVNSPYEVMKYFREISNDTRDWLHKYEKKHKVNMCIFITQYNELNTVRLSFNIV